MKKNIMLIIILLVLLSCATIKMTPCIVDKPDGSNIELSQFCNESRQAGRTSYICNLEKEYQLDPCVLHRGLEVVSQEGLVLEGYTFEEFEAWANYVKDRVKAGITFGTLQSIALEQFTKINKMVGAQILLLGNVMVQLPQNEIIEQDDTILVLSSIDDLVQEVKRLDIWTK